MAEDDKVDDIPLLIIMIYFNYSRFHFFLDDESTFFLLSKQTHRLREVHGTAGRPHDEADIKQCAGKQDCPSLIKYELTNMKSSLRDLGT